MCVPILKIFLLKLYVLHISAGVFVVLRPFFFLFCVIFTFTSH